MARNLGLWPGANRKAKIERIAMRLKAAIAAAAILTFAAGAANADAQKYVARLTGAAEVPSNAATAKGDITAMLDTDTSELTYTVTYSGLSGPATGAGFHGPAGKAAEGPVVSAAASPAGPPPITRIFFGFPVLTTKSSARVVSKPTAKNTRTAVPSNSATSFLINRAILPAGE